MAIVNHVLEMGKRLRRPKVGEAKMSEDGILAKLEKELEDCLRNATINPLLGMPGKHHTNKHCA